MRLGKNGVVRDTVLQSNFGSPPIWKYDPSRSNRWFMQHASNFAVGWLKFNRDASKMLEYIHPHDRKAYGQKTAASSLLREIQSMKIVTMIPY